MRKIMVRLTIKILTKEELFKNRILIYPIKRINRINHNKIKNKWDNQELLHNFNHNMLK
jgi:hypothetical protein